MDRQTHDAPGPNRAGYPRDWPLACCTKLAGDLGLTEVGPDRLTVTPGQQTAAFQPHGYMKKPMLGPRDTEVFRNVGRTWNLIGFDWPSHPLA